VLIEASNGASDYGNKFGEPVVCGFARSFGQRLMNGERCEYVKPIMFSGGIGAIARFPSLKGENDTVLGINHALQNAPYSKMQFKIIENDAALVDANRLAQMMAISRREKCTVSIVGTVTDENRVVLTNFADEADVRKPVDFDTKILGEREKKVFHLNSTQMPLRQLELPAGLTVRQALEMVLRLPSVASKRYLTSKVDRSVTGLVARQQCVGPLHTPLADVAVVALSYFDKIFFLRFFTSYSLAEETGYIERQVSS
ncbi:hypothetical protein TELCIR_13600, partial [Teladorsagia circumcincta]